MFAVLTPPARRRKDYADHSTNPSRITPCGIIADDGIGFADGIYRDNPAGLAEPIRSAAGRCAWLLLSGVGITS